jgi:hypothetical protein
LYIEYLLPAGVRDEEGGAGVFLRVLGIGLEAEEGSVGGGDGVRVMLLEILDDLVQRFPQRVNVESVEPDPLVLQPALVVPAQPFRKSDDLPVGPHPGRPAVVAAQRLLGCRVTQLAMDVAVDAIAVGPVPLDGNEAEALLLDQATADPCSPEVILVRPVRRLAEQDVAGIADPLEEGVQVLGVLERGGKGEDLPAEASAQIRFIVRDTFHRSLLVPSTYDLVINSQRMTCGMLANARWCGRELRAVGKASAFHLWIR